METTVRGCSQRQERSAELLRFGLIWDALTDCSAAWCARVEVRACDRAATGVARGAVEVEGVVRSRRLGSAQPCHGTECTRVAVGPMHALWTVSECGSGVCILPVAAYKSIPGQGSHPYSPPHTSIASVHGSDRYMVYHECTQLILDFHRSRKSSVFAASVDPLAAWESTQGSYHTD